MYDLTKTQIQDIDYFESNLKSFLKDKNLRFKQVIISNGEIVGVFDGLDTATAFAVENLKKGKYIIQQVVDENDMVNFV